MMNTVYSLRDDLPRIQRVQQTLSAQIPLGKLTSMGLFGTSQFWQNIQSGFLPLKMNKGYVVDITPTTFVMETFFDKRRLDFPMLGSFTLYQIGATVEVYTVALNATIEEYGLLTDTAIVEIRLRPNPVVQPIIQSEVPPSPQSSSPQSTPAEISDIVAKDPSSASIEPPKVSLPSIEELLKTLTSKEDEVWKNQALSGNYADAVLLLRKTRGFAPNLALQLVKKIKESSSLDQGKINEKQKEKIDPPLLKDEGSLTKKLFPTFSSWVGKKEKD